MAQFYRFAVKLRLILFVGFNPSVQTKYLTLISIIKPSTPRKLPKLSDTVYGHVTESGSVMFLKQLTVHLFQKPHYTSLSISKATLRCAVNNAAN